MTPSFMTPSSTTPSSTTPSSTTPSSTTPRPLTPWPLGACAALVVLLALPSVAAAQAPPTAAAAPAAAVAPGPDWAIYGEAGLTAGGISGALGDDWSVDRGGFTLGAGFRRHQLAVGVHYGLFAVDSSVPERDNADLFGLELGGDVTMYLREGKTEPFVRVGYRKAWFFGNTEVTRTCAQTGDCLAGYWTEVPSYSAHGPVIAIGEQLTLRETTGSGRGSMLFFVTVQLEAAPLKVELPGGKVTGQYIGLRLSLGLGGGPHRRVASAY
jgi:hypothetical protein